MKINVTRTSMPSFEEYCEEIRDIWDSAWLTNMGPKHQKFEGLLCKYLDVENASVFTNGHLALETAIALFNFKPASEIITTPFTFVSTTNSIVRNNLIPVFCDIKKDDYTIDPSKIEQLITEKTVAIVAVHVYGHVCDVEAIEKIAKKHNLKVIYDAAHAFGVKYKGIGVGNFGDVSMFSFHATKVFNTIEGGALTYKDKSFKDKILKLRNFGIQENGDCIAFGGNTKMSEFQAAMGICNLKHIESCILKRKAIYQRYIEKLSNTKGIRLPNIDKNLEYNYSYFPVVFDGYKFDRDEIAARLAKHDIFARKYFYPSIDQFECYKQASFKGDAPISREISKKVLCLPLYAELPLEAVDKICSIILDN